MSALLKPTRRNFLLGMLAAPLVVRAASIMPVKAAPQIVRVTGRDIWDNPFYEDFVTDNLRYRMTERYSFAVRDWHATYADARLAT